jgi:hypothetical protein
MGAMTRMRLFAITLSLLAFVLPAVAVGADQDSSTPAKKKKSKSPVDISIPTMADLPKADGLQSTIDAPKEDKPSAPTKHKYEVVRVASAQQLVPHGDSFDTKYPVTRFEVNNLPMVLPGFHTLVRVKSPDRIGTNIEVKFVDPDGSTLLSADGALVFSGHEEADFVADWDSFSVKHAGDYTLVVTVAGEPLSKTVYPLTQQLHATLTETPTDGGH